VRVKSRRLTESNIERQQLRDLAERRRAQRAEAKDRADRKEKARTEDPAVRLYREELAKRTNRSGRRA
jgi:hypothetical protein